MASDAVESSRDPACVRCGRGLTERHWIRLVAVHQGTLADRYRDTENRICIDCLAALGLLEFELDASTEEKTGGRLRDRFELRRSLGR